MITLVITVALWTVALSWRESRAEIGLEIARERRLEIRRAIRTRTSSLPHR